MKSMKKVLSLMLAAALAGSLLTGCGDTTQPSDSQSPDASQSAQVSSTPAGGQTGSELDPNKKVDKIEVGSNPTKTAYVSGEEFSLEGGNGHRDL